MGESDDMKHDRMAVDAHSARAVAAPIQRRSLLALAGATLLDQGLVPGGLTGWVSGLGVAGATMLTPGRAQAQEMSNTLPDLIDKSRQAVVAVGTFSATDNPRFGFRGTGFVVGDGKTIVTCAHVIPNPLEKELSILVPAAGNASGTPQQRSGATAAP